MQISPEITKYLQNLKIPSLNNIQKATLAAESSKDMILIAPTGSGKTLAFLLPIFENLERNSKNIQVLIICPSRELVLQTHHVFAAMKTGYKVNSCYGGHSVEVETNNLSTPPAILIGTPGRLVHLHKKHAYTAESITTLVLDEFDKALEFGFQEDMTYLISKIPKSSKRILTSATQAIEIPAFAGVRSPEVLDYSDPAVKADLTIKIIKTDSEKRSDVLFRLLCHVGHEATLVFCNQRETVEEISKLLAAKSISHDIYHGKLDQDLRERALFRLRNGTTRILVTTDLASRGLDIPEIRHIVHYQMPHTKEAFIHRNGRTARMFASGTAYFILSGKDYLPDFITETTENIQLPKKLNLPPPAEWETLYIAGGRKDKISKTDIVGLLCQKGKLTSDEIGQIDIRDFASFVAIKASKTSEVLKLIANEPIKRKKLKIEKAN